jgi:hypothetical protein
MCLTSISPEPIWPELCLRIPLGLLSQWPLARMERYWRRVRLRGRFACGGSPTANFS